jgi:hypothetical protein
LREILSREDYISLAARLDHSSDAKNILDFTLQMLRHDTYLSKKEPSITGMMRRARRFMLEVISKIRAVPGFNTPNDPDRYTLPLLLYILDYVKVRNISN